MAAGFVELCLDGDFEEVRAALQSGVDVNSMDGHGWMDGLTGLMGSLANGHTEVASLLLEQEGIDINIISDYRNETALHFAAQDDQNNECLAMLLARNTSVNQRDSFGGTPLYDAVQYNAVRCVQLLISDERTDPNIKSDDGESPMMCAVKQNHVNCVELLLADPRVDLMTRDNYERDEEEATR